MIFAVTGVSVEMCVNMRVLMCMNHITVTVFVRMRMFMLMSVLQFDGIFYHEICADYHDN